MHRLRIRRAGLSDVAALALLFDAYRQFYRQEPDLAAAARYLRSRLSRKESVIFMAQNGRDVLGFVQLYPTFSSVSMKPLWILNDLYVAPKGRRKGVAAALMEHSRKLAARTRAEGLILDTAADNTPAQSLYEKLGWKREKDFYHYNFDL